MIRSSLPDIVKSMEKTISEDWADTAFDIIGEQCLTTLSNWKKEKDSLLNNVIVTKTQMKVTSDDRIAVRFPSECIVLFFIVIILICLYCGKKNKKT